MEVVGVPSNLVVRVSTAGVIRHLRYGHEFMSDVAQIDPRHSLHRTPACIHVSSTLHFDGSGLNV